MINILIDTVLLGEIEMLGGCPICLDALDSGTGFGKRDYECESCDFTISFPVEIYLAFLQLLPY